MEITVHRVLAVSRGRADPRAKLENGAVPELMEPEECLESRVPRVTVVLMDCPDCLVRKDTGGNQDPRDQSEPQERTDREEKMERSDPGAWPARVVLEVCWDRVDLPDLQAPRASPEWTGHMDPRGTWDHKVNQALPDSKEFLEHRVSLVLKAPSDHLEKRDLRADPGFLVYPEQTVLLVILEKRVHLGRREARVLLVHRVLSATLALVGLRELMASVD